MAGSAGARLDTLQSRRLAGGLSIQELAQRAVTTDERIQRIERGDTTRPEEVARLLAALAPPVAITSSSIANPSQLTVATHQFQTGDTVTIAGHVGSTPDINGSRVVTRINGTTVSIPVNVTGGGTGGTMTIDPASVTIAAL